MEGNRIRDPWKVLESWLQNYAQTGRQELLDRSLELGQQLDPDGGLTRVHRLLLAAGLTDEEAQQNLYLESKSSAETRGTRAYARIVMLLSSKNMNLFRRR